MCNIRPVKFRGDHRAFPTEGGCRSVVFRAHLSSEVFLVQQAWGSVHSSIHHRSVRALPITDYSSNHWSTLPMIAVSFLSLTCPSYYCCTLPITELSFLLLPYPSCHWFVLPITAVSFLSLICPSYYCCLHLIIIWLFLLLLYPFYHWFALHITAVPFQSISWPSFYWFILPVTDVPFLLLMFPSYKSCTLPITDLPFLSLIYPIIAVSFLSLMCPS